MRNDVTRRLGTALRLPLLLLGLLAACGESGEGPAYEVAVLIAPYDTADVVAARRGFELALDEVNADSAGAPRFELHFVEDARTAATVADACRRLVTEDSVDAFLAYEPTGLRPACNEIVWRADAPYLSAGPAAFDYCAENLYQIGALPNQLAAAAVGYHAGEGAGSVYLIGNQDAVSEERLAWVDRAAQENGATLAGSALVPAGTADFSEALGRAVAARPGAIVEALAESDRPAFYRSLRADPRASALPVVSLGLAEQGAAALGGAEGVTSASDYFVTVASPANQRFAEAFREKFGDDAVPTGPAAASYEALRLLAAAVRSAASTAGPEVTRALASARVDGPRGSIAFSDGSRFATLNVYLGRANADGGFQLLTFRPAVAPRPSCD